MSKKKFCRSFVKLEFSQSDPYGGGITQYYTYMDSMSIESKSESKFNQNR